MRDTAVCADCLLWEWGRELSPPDLAARAERLVAMSVGHPNTARMHSLEQREKGWYQLLFTGCSSTLLSACTTSCLSSSTEAELTGSRRIPRQSTDEPEYQGEQRRIEDIELRGQLAGNSARR
jgi:hypothetical protein